MDRNPDLSSYRELISSSTKVVDELVTELSKEEMETKSLQLPCDQTVTSARDDLHSALQSLSSSFWSQQGVNNSRSSAGSDNSLENDSSIKERPTTHSAVRNKGVYKVVYPFTSGVPLSGSPHWV